MLRLAGIALLASFAFAQEPAAAPEPPPPPGVDEALRARIQEFYGYFMSEQFRKAEKLVAEDSQDWFYNHNKPHYLSIEIRRITYSENFTRAEALTLCEQNFSIRGFTTKAPVPVPSTWKLVDGQWFWYVVMDKPRDTPFGPMQPRSAASSAPERPAVVPTTIDFAMNKVKPEATSVTVKRSASAEVAIRNTANGSVTLIIDEKPAGVEVKLNPALVSAGEKTMLSVRAAEDARPGRITLRVQETGELITIEVKLQ